MSSLVQPHLGTSVHSRRVIFVDLARALAVVFMLYGHAIDALLAPEYRAGAWYEAWQFQRGLTSSLFLLLSGFAFSIATARHWALQVQWSPAVVKRARRFALFILLGYSLHVPPTRLGGLAHASDADWQAFLAVDVLQLIGVTFFGVQALVMVARTERRFMRATLVLAAAVTAAAPAVWSVDWTGHLPLLFASYLSPATGSLFPVVPWAAFVLIGAALGQSYAHWGASHLVRYANARLIVPGVVLAALWLARGLLPASLFGTGPHSYVPALMLIRAGVCLVLVGGIAHLSRRMTQLPHIVSALAQESLLVYFVHLCIVYGSPWNVGLAQLYGSTLTPLPMLVTIVLVIGAMTLLAWYWNWWKHTRPRLARWTTVAAGVVLLSRLL